MSSQTSNEVPSEEGVVATWDDAAGTGTITADAGGGTVTFTRATIGALSPQQSRHWPTMAAAYLLAGQRVLFRSNAGSAQFVVADHRARIVTKTAVS